MDVFLVPRTGLISLWKICGKHTCCGLAVRIVFLYSIVGKLIIGGYNDSEAGSIVLP